MVSSECKKISQSVTIEIGTMTSPAAHKWIFSARFRRNAFGWRSQPAIARVKEAVAEVKKISRKYPVLAAEGAVLFLEKVSPAFALEAGMAALRWLCAGYGV